LKDKDDTFLSLKNPSEGLYKVKGSKHFSFAFPVSSESDIKERLSEIRVLHSAARHHCYAWRLGHDAASFRSNDDGEPANTAGQPILGVLKSNELTNVIIVVVRYFGGTKLGVGGLISAYRTAASYAVASGTIVKCIRTQTYLVKYPYTQMGAVMNVLKRAGVTPQKTNFQQTCSLEASIRLRDATDFSVKLSNLNEVQVTEILQV
jgi:uncharacterized YigZ family protein